MTERREKPDFDGPHTGSPDSVADEIEQIRTLLAAANRRLLGGTIAATDQDWRAPSALPGWTRGHVATHLARNADALARLANWAHTGQRQQMYPQPRDAEIEAGAGRSGLDLQTDLDTSAGLLDAEFERVAEADAWEEMLEHRDGTPLPARALPPSRLGEVVLHHLDLDLGFAASDIDTSTAEVCLRWCSARLARREDFPAIELITDAGSSHRVGSGEPAGTVGGPANLLLGWVTSRSGPDGLSGDPVQIPGFG